MPAQVDLRDLCRALDRARKGKKPSANMADFECNWLDRILTLEQQLIDGTWSPSPSVCRTVARPKAREIHAPDFADRVVHHWCVPPLEAVFERKFIFHSFSNRVEKGTLAAVEWLERYARQVYSGQGGGWYLQLDVRNFFNSIWRPGLWRKLKRAMQRANLPMALQRAVHALLRKSPQEIGVIHRSTPAERAQVPKHKRLESAAAGFGLPIGNLSSQFFANVWLDALDQFVKHALKVKRYVRYVDDFVIVHKCREQLQQWQQQIERFLRDELKLDLKADVKLRPLASGIDFLGYVVHPTHRRVRRRVVSHAREKLDAFAQRHVNADQGRITATPEQFHHLRSVWASYQGHFNHASSWRLQQQMYRRYPWLAPITQTRRRFDRSLSGRPVSIRIKFPQQQRAEA